jgi:hypothetical protein
MSVFRSIWRYLTRPGLRKGADEGVSDVSSYFCTPGSTVTLHADVRCFSVECVHAQVLLKRDRY